MFTHFLKDVDDVILRARGSEHVFSENMTPIYNVIENFVKDNSLVLSNVETLINKKKGPFSSFTIYGDNIFRHANNLANIIATVNIYVLMYTNVKNEDFSISVDGSRLVRLFNVKHKLMKSINAVMIDGIQFYPPELELIDVCHKLYLPTHAKDWDTLNTWKTAMIDQVYNRRDLLVSGGKNTHRKKVKKKLALDNSIVFNWLMGRDDYVLIGQNALYKMRGDRTYHQKVQIIIGGNTDKVLSEFSNLIFQTYGIRPYTKTTTGIFISEPRLSRTTASVIVRVNGEKKKIHLLDVFNSAAYELVPYTTHGNLHVGLKNVLVMHFLLELRLLRVLFCLDFVKKGFLLRSSADIYENIKHIEKLNVHAYAMESYLGTHVDLIRYTQKRGTQNIFYPYSPEHHRYTRGEYRKI